MAAAFLLFSCFVGPVDSEAQTAATAQPLYGMWYISPRGNPDTDTIREEFRHNSATGKDEIVRRRFCQGDYRAVIATAISPVEISESTIRVLRSASDVKKGELNSECRIQLDAGLLSYTLSPDGNRLTITDPHGHPDVVEFARQDTSSAAVLPPSVYGTWLLPPQHDRDTHVEMRLVFYSTPDDKGKVRQIATCMKADNTITSQVDSDILVTADEIKILDSASHVQKDGPFTCEARITAGTLHYVLSAGGATMKLSAANGASLMLTREHKRGLN